MDVSEETLTHSNRTVLEVNFAGSVFFQFWHQDVMLNNTGEKYQNSTLTKGVIDLFCDASAQGSSASIISSYCEELVYQIEFTN